MVSGGTVSGDQSSFSSYLSNYQSLISDLSSNWKGASFDNLNSKASEFYSEFGDTISKEMEAFANACNLYEEYQEAKSSLDTARSNYNKSVSNGDSSSASTYNSQVDSYTTKLNSLKTEINSYLSQAGSSKLEATSLSGTTTTTSGGDTTTTNSDTTSSNLVGSTNEEKVWNYLISKGFSKEGAAGIMGNLKQESNMRPDNVQNNMGYSDEDYTNGIKNGTITRESFMNDKRGYGIAQWTYYTRKAALYDYLGPENIDSLSGQLDFMLSEMSSSLTSQMKSATDSGSAAVTFHNVYEQSADKSMSTRKNYASGIYGTYANSNSDAVTT